LLACADDHHDLEDELFDQAFEEAQNGKADGECAGVDMADRSGFAKRVVLTFDDGPDPAVTPRVIDILKRHRAPATFFTQGSKYSSTAAIQLAARIAGDPDYILANHTFNHNNTLEIELATFLDEVNRTDRLIRNAGEMPRYFRFPYGAATCAAVRGVQERGYIVTGWHVDSADWCYGRNNGRCVCRTNPCGEREFARQIPVALRTDMKGWVMRQVRANNGGVVLFHDVRSYTADQLDAILTQMESEGFTFARLDDVTLLPQLHGIVPNFIGDACMTNAQCPFAGGRCHPAGFCTSTCAGTCPDSRGKAPTFCIADRAIANAGMCVSRAVPLNGDCATVPNSVKRSEARFVGTSGIPAATANVCAPR
jgi:peptidoglycan/xylan/chitin deacetylase (PgdA/CDA1 family)